MAACAGKRERCVAVRSNGVEKAFSGIVPATLATLRRGLEVGRVSDYAGYISPAAADRARANLTRIADFHDRIMGYRFADRVNPVDLREFANSIDFHKTLGFQTCPGGYMHTDVEKEFES